MMKCKWHCTSGDRQEHCRIIISWRKRKKTTVNECNADDTNADDNDDDENDADTDAGDDENDTDTGADNENEDDEDDVDDADNNERGEDADEDVNKDSVEEAVEGSRVQYGGGAVAARENSSNQNGANNERSNSDDDDNDITNIGVRYTGSTALDTVAVTPDTDSSADDNNNRGEQLPLPSDEIAASVNEMTLLSLQPITAETNELPIQQNEKRQSTPNLSSMESIQKMKTSLKDLAEASNITLEALEAAILLKQQQFLKKQQETITTSTTTTTATPLKNVYNFEATKVMNAPREYYPVGYDRNFDDNFASRVDLPETSFYCGDQKHFPGLYADEDLGCMVSVFITKNNF
ncbi:protein PFC0760c-like [Pseudomyrmex gracilis]|uniref:protein PFC0760c-like n=1 Tax=Pseudomyrmex gracilis TaxID=219809 RepID=UPI000994C23A|nr:protein PFC0760c-like [Pseudomyrmex gracilis]